MCTTWQHETLLKIKKGGLLMYPINVRCSTKKKYPQKSNSNGCCENKKNKSYSLLHNAIKDYGIFYGLEPVCLFRFINQFVNGAIRCLCTLLNLHCTWVNISFLLFLFCVSFFCRSCFFFFFSKKKNIKK